jgi:hypothetical protein
MRTTAIFLLLIACCRLTYAQIGVKYYPAIEPSGNMQYFKPNGSLSVGDCMPFYHNGTFFEYWLLDSLHGENLDGLGGHQWVLSTTTDLKNWKQYPIVLGIDEEWEKSICTGSVVFYNGKYFAFYATRLIQNGKVNEQLSYAISEDGIHFGKQKPNPFYTSAPGYSKRNFRDPKVFVDSTGEFHLFVASDQEKPFLSHAAGCLVHLSSRDLKTWTVHDPVLTGQPSTPECPDYFFWKGWYYLVFSDNSNTYYVKSPYPYGPWEEPLYQALNEDWANVVKTAEFSGGRRIASAWIPDRLYNKDNNREIFGGNTVFRELIQEPDGTLDTKFPEEMIPETGQELTTEIILDLQSSRIGNKGISINSPGGVGVAHLEHIPLNCRISMEIEPAGPDAEYGLYLQSNEHARNGYRLNFEPYSKTVSLGNTKIEAVDGLNRPLLLDVVMKDGIIDVNIDNRRTILNRTYEEKGSFLWFYAKHGKVIFSSITIAPLK